MKDKRKGRMALMFGPDDPTYFKCRADYKMLLGLLKEWNLAGFFSTHAKWQEWEKDFGGRVRAAIAKAEGK